MEKIRWGILSSAKIGIENVIPAMQAGNYCDIIALGSRDRNKAKSVADMLDIQKSYGSYEELLSDKDVDAVYIPLPNHLHVEWSIKSLAAGKHVLCEKPIGLNYDDAKRIQAAAKQYPKLKIMEAFMYRHHPQTVKAKALITSGKIGEIKNIHAIFSYNNTDPDNIRNKAEIGGGGMLDIGCYCISISRYLFDAEPTRVCASIDYDPALRIDRLASGILEFSAGTATFSCATQLFPQQSVVISGDLGKIEIDMPFTPSPQMTATIRCKTEENNREYVFDPIDQYTIQGDLFSEAILKNQAVPTPLSDALANMRVIDRLFQSAKMGKFVSL